MTKTKKITPTMLARDVLKLQAAKTIKAESGSYCIVRGKAPREANLRSALRSGAVTCGVCALGSLFVSRISRVNGISVGDASWPEAGLFDPLERIFGLDQMGLIEAAFEVSRYGGTWNSEVGDEPSLDAAIAFGQHYRSDRNRLIAIMKNIIAHRGKFVPPPVRKVAQ